MRNISALVSPTDKLSFKGDQQLGSKHKISFLWNNTTYRNKPGPDGVPGLPEPLWNGQISGAISLTRRMR